MPFSSPTREWLWGGGPSPISHHLLTSISLSPIRANDACSTAYSFCGLKDKLYPDKRTMGYPFDRRLPNANLTELVGAFGNMAKTDLRIVFNDRVIDKA